MLDQRLRDATDGVRVALTDLIPPPIDSPLPAAGRRTRWWAIAVAAAATVFLVIGAIALMGPFAGEESTPITDPLVPTTVPATTIPETTFNPLPESSAPDPIDVTGGVAVADGTLWASTGAGMVRWDLEERSAELFTSADGLPFAEGASGGVAVAPDGTVWAFTWNQGLAYFDGTVWSEPAGYDQLDIVKPRCVVGEECLNPLTAMAVGPDGVLFLAVGSETLLRFDGVDWSVLPVTPAETGGGTGWTGYMAVASDGTLWAASWEELLAYDEDTWARYTTADGLPSGAISSVAVAPSGDIWVATTDDFDGTPSGGVARFDGDSWTVFNETDGLYEDAATGLTVGPDGTVWAIYGANDDPSAGMERAAGGISRFDGMTWSTETIPDVGMGFGWGSAAVDNTGTLWIGSRWGVVGFDGADTTVLRVPEGIRPAIEVPHVVIEGGEDILATTVAKPTAAVATCPAGSDPDRPGSMDQARPGRDWYIPLAMDRQSGRVIAVVESVDGMTLETWAYDICTNTWTQMDKRDLRLTFEPTSRPVRPSVLVYDADSDLVVAMGLVIDSYDFDTDTWEEHGKPPASFNFDPRAVYDPVSGLIVVRDIESSDMWAYDVDTDTWTPIRQGPISPPIDESSDSPIGSTLFGQLHAYDASTDRIVLYFADNGAGAPATWSYDPRAGEWTIEETLTPDLHVGAFGQPYGKAAYDETARRTVITADGLVGGYDSARHEWGILWESSSKIGPYGVGTGPHHRLGDAIVYDPTNERIIVFGGDARLPSTDDNTDWVSMDDVWAFNTGTGTWTELLAPSSP
jgi:hypothetical protein